MAAFHATVAPVVRVEHSASLVGLGGILVRGEATRRGKASSGEFHVVLRPSRLIRRNDGLYTVQSHAFPDYTVTVGGTPIGGRRHGFALLSAWDAEGHPVDFTWDFTWE